MIKIFENFNKPEVKYDWYDNGKKKSESWSLNGKEHREDGPSVQRWYNNGQKRYEIWELNGKRHIESGPFFQWWNERGKKYYEYWALNGIEYTREEWLERLKEIGSPYYEEQLSIYNAEKYNI